MGNRPSSNLSIVAMHQTANLYDNASKYSAAHKAIMKESSNIFTVTPDLESIQSNINKNETVSSMEGYFYKDWIISYQEIPDQSIGAQISDVGEQEERALGIQWNVKED